MENGTVTQGFERQFGHTFIVWKITNFCFETSRSDFFVSTPEFCVDGRHVTKWKMTFNPKAKDGEEYVFLVTLERMGSDAAPAVVFVDSKLLLMDSTGRESQTIRYQSKFVKNCRQDIPLWDINYVRERLHMETYKYGTVRIWCQLIVDFDDYCRTFEEPIDVGLKTLSENLLKLYKSGADHDVILRIGDKDILAHKAILFTRSTYLANSFKNENKVVDLSFLDFKTVQDVVAYFYSADVNYIARTPSVFMYDCATLFNVMDIRQFYNPQSLEIDSAIDVREHAFVWAVKNFKQIHQKSIVSPLLTSEYMDAGFRILLNAKCTKDPPVFTHLSLFADTVQGKIPKNHCIVFSIIDNNKELWSKRMQLSNESNRRFGFDDFIEKDQLAVLLKKLTGDTLNIALTIEIHNDSVSTNKRYKISNSVFPVHKYYEFLPVFVGLIFRKSIWTDVTLETEGASYKANKCILSARSPVFRAMLKEMKGDKLTIPDIKSNTLWIIINYMYSGIYDVDKLDEIFDVYKAAKRFSLTCLKERCLNILRKNFNAQSVFDALMLSDELQDTELKTLALNFIRENKNSIFEDSNWKNLIDKKPSLFTEIMEFVNERNGFKESVTIQYHSNVN